MRISEMRAREDLDAIVRTTLARDFTEQLGRPVTVSAKGPGQRWLVQPLLSAFYTPQISGAARRHLRDDFRWSPVPTRVAPQFALGTALASAPGLRLAGRTGFFVDPPLHGAPDLLIMPGNRRIRLFDFDRRVCRVLLKDGFPPRVMETEVAVRGRGAQGPFPPITQVAPDLSWFEEPLVDGLVLPRLPPWTRAAPLKARALTALAAFTRPSRRTVDAAAHLEPLLARVAQAAAEVTARYGAASAAASASAPALAALAATPGELTVATTHGDFQPGNILVTRRRNDVLILDWEHSRTRLADYDALVLGLSSRAAVGLGARVRAFVSGAAPCAGLGPEAADLAWRRATAAAFLLEDLCFYLEESVEVPGSRPSAGLAVLTRELASFGPSFGDLGGLRAARPKPRSAS
ncbi:MAG: phosphotransferase [Myxococcota bacterium]